MRICRSERESPLSTEGKSSKCRRSAPGTNGKRRAVPGGPFDERQGLRVHETATSLRGRGQSVRTSPPGDAVTTWRVARASAARDHGTAGPGNDADADEAEGGARCLNRRKPVQMPEQDQLIEEVVLEPETLRRTAGSGEPGVPATDHREQRIGRYTRARAAKCSARSVSRSSSLMSRRNGPVVERVGPDGEFAPHASIARAEKRVESPLSTWSVTAPMIAEPPACRGDVRRRP